MKPDFCDQIIKVMVDDGKYIEMCIQLFPR